MRLFILFAVAIATAAAAHPAEAYEFIGGNIHVRSGNTKDPVIMWANTYHSPEPEPDMWHEVDVTEYGVPADATAVFLSGLLIITHGTDPAICDMHLTLRAPSDPLEPTNGKYQFQVVEAHVGGGQRTNFDTYVPIEDGKFEFYWSRNTWEQWPYGCAYGFNVSLQAYVR